MRARLPKLSIILVRSTGGGNIISNLGAPLFSKTANGVTMKNLTLDGTALTKAPGNNFAAFIADCRGTGFTLTNLTNKTAINVSNNNVGAFVGYCKITGMATLTNCVNEADIAGVQNVGGLVGQQGIVDNAELHLSFQSCANKGNVSGTQRSVAGIIGHTQVRTNYTDTYNEGKITSTANSVGGLLGRCSRGWQYFTRCHNSGAVSGTTQVAGIFADYDRYGSEGWATFEDCYNEGTVTGTGDNVGGFVGRGNTNSASNFVLTRCYNKGNITSVKAYRPGMLIQWTNATVAITDCWNIGEIVCTDGTYTGSGVNTLSNTGTVTNSYDFANADLTPSYGRPEGYEDAWMTNGHFCYFLNGNSSESPKWYQTLGDDQHPVLDNTHSVVYGIAEYRCDGVTAKGAVSYSNVNTSVVDAHVFVDGVCSVCGQLPTNGSGQYEISTAAALTAFAALVNGGETAAKGVVTAPIDLSGVEFHPIGNVAKPFTGTFDGQLYPITNISNMMFGTTKGATITGIALESGTIDAVSSADAVHTGSIIGYATASGGSLTNSYSKVTINASNGDLGGLVGKWYGTMENVAFLGNFGDGVTASTWSGLVGSTNANNSATISNAMVYATMPASFNAETGSRGAFVGWLHTNTVSNSYVIAAAGDAKAFTKLMGAGTGSVSGSEFKSAEAFASGEVAYLLGSAFHQNIGIDATPVLDGTHGTVYRTYMSGENSAYSNTSGATVASMILTDVADYAADADFTATSLTYNRTLAAGGYHSLCLPFAVTTTMLGEGGKLFTLKEVGDDTVTLTEVSSVAAGVPCFASVTSDYDFGTISNVEMVANVSNGTNLKGTFTEVTGDDAAGVYKLDPNGTYFAQTTSTGDAALIKPFRSYIAGGASGVKTLNILLSDGTATSLTPALSEEKEAAIYDLAGRRVEKATKGIYIVNGKKVMK